MYNPNKVQDYKSQKKQNKGKRAPWNPKMGGLDDKSFGALASLKDKMSAADLSKGKSTKDTEAYLEKDFKDRVLPEFKQVLAGKFNRIPKGARFASQIPGVKDITITTSEGNKTVQLIVWYEKKLNSGKTAERNEVLTIAEDGDFTFKVPKELKGVNRNDLMMEAFGDLRVFGLDKDVQRWVPMGDINEGTSRRIGAEPRIDKGEAPEYEQLPIDPYRVEYFTNHNDFVFGMFPEDPNRFQACVFRRGMILTSDTMKRRDRIMVFSEMLDEKDIKKVLQEGVSTESAMELLKKYGVDVEETSRGPVVKIISEDVGMNHPAYNARKEIKDKYYTKMDEIIADQLA